MSATMTTTITQTETAPEKITERRDVDATLNYYNGQRGKDAAPSYIWDLESCYKREQIDVVKNVHDLRGREDQFNLDNAAFQVVHHESAVKVFEDVETLKPTLWPETVELIQKVTGAALVKPYNLQLRHKEGGPAKAVHCDLNENAASRLRRSFPDEADELLSKYSRWASVNTWRPLKTVYKDPLAILDGRTLGEADLAVYDLHCEKWVESYYTCFNNDTHQWYYLHNQRHDEPILFKGYDSVKDGRPRYAAHTSFTDEEYAGLATRESVEVRCFVFWN